MENLPQKHLKDRQYFLNQLETDLQRTKQLQTEANRKINDLEDTSTHIKELQKQPEHVALIPLAKHLYIPGRIVHTGEYLLDAPAHPESYTVLKTAEQTVDTLQRRVQEERDRLRKIQSSELQLSERINLLTGQLSLNLDESGEGASGEDEECEMGDMPEQITSDRGVAVKVGGFYEILEFEG